MRKLWFSSGSALAVYGQLRTAHLPAECICCQVGAVSNIWYKELLLVHHPAAEKSKVVTLRRAEVKLMLKSHCLCF